MLQKMSKNSSLKETGPSYSQKFVYSDNPGQNVWHKVKKSSKIGQDFVFFDSYCQSLISEGRLGTRLRLHPNLTFF